jgi:hypothetical protein
VTTTTIDHASTYSDVTVAEEATADDVILVVDDVTAINYDIVALDCDVVISGHA